MATGTIKPATFLDLPDKSINIDHWDSSTWHWLDDIPYRAQAAMGLNGPMTDNAPVDVIHWSVTGGLAPSGLEHWQTCLNLMPHI